MVVESLIAVFEPANLFFMFIGVAAGIFFGALPGLTVTMAVAVMLTFTYGMSPSTALFLLLGVYCGGIYGGSISAILLRVPGTPASAAVVEDGFALVEKGRAGEALRMALYASATAGILSASVLLFLAPQVAQFAISFGAPEFFALALFGLTIIATLSDGSSVKGFVMGILGMFVATVGIDPIGGTPRLTFGNVNLQGGIDLIPALIGLFAISELTRRAMSAHLRVEPPVFVDTKLPFFRTIYKYSIPIIKSSAIGTFLGAVPGVGSAITTFLGYNEAKRSSKNKEDFGKGSLEGVAAAEAGNNSVTGATLIPLLTLGIPGDAVTAVLLGAFTLQGIQPGPQLFTNQASLVYTIMFGLFVINIFMYLIGTFAIRFYVRVTSIPTNVLIPLLLTLCFVGAFAINSTVFDAKLMMIFGLVGIIMPLLGFPVVPMLLGIILGPIAEESLRQALILSGGSWLVFFSSPVAVAFILLAVLSFVGPLLKPILQRRWT